LEKEERWGCLGRKGTVEKRPSPEQKENLERRERKEQGAQAFPLVSYLYSVTKRFLAKTKLYEIFKKIKFVFL
jgi:hypothetical protein